MKLYFKYVKQQLKAGFAYKSSYLLTMLGQLLSTVAVIIGIYFLFQRFGHIGPYSFNDIFITYAVVYLVFSFDEMFFRGFDEFDKLVGKGDLDRLLLRPRNIVLQICGYKVEVIKIGRVLISLTLLIIACIKSSVVWTFGNVMIIFEMVFSGIITFFGVYLLSSSLTIFTIKKAEVINIFTDGGRELCYYPLDVFKKGITKFFTFIIPFASFNYMPLRYLLGMSGASVWNIVYPAFSILFAVIGYVVFNFCLRFYKSAG